MFQVTTLDLDNLPRTEDGKIDYSKDFFGKETNLTVSGQLNGETFAQAFRNIYTFGPTFRAENSNTTRHAAEFWMIEPEIAFADLSDDMKLAEDMIKFIIAYVLDHAPEEMAFFNQFVDKGLIDRLQPDMTSDFGHVTYTEAVKLLEEHNDKFDYKVFWGCDLQTEHERYLTEQIFKRPVFVTDYPKEIKAFYMKLNPDGNDYYFRVCFLDPFQGSVMASFAMEEFGAKKAYVLSMLGDDYTVGLAKNFVIAFEAAGGEIVADETFVEGTADFSAYLNNAVAGGADVIFAPSAIAYAPQIIEQASALGISLPILGGDTWENSAISDAQNGTDMQVFVSTFFDENDESGLAKEFVTGYKAWLNGNSQNLTNNGGNDVVAAVSALGYDAYMTAVAAIEKAQSADGSAIRDALAGLSIDAVTGSISFDANGDAIKSTAYIKQAIDGGFQFYKVQNAD